jgi:hypothetical protein
VNYILKELFNVEYSMAITALNSHQLDIAEGYCQQCLVHSKKFGVEREKKTSMIFKALSNYCKLRMVQDNYLDALTFAEEGYNLVVVAYDPVHSRVQDAAGLLIEILIEKGDLYDISKYVEWGLVNCITT